MAQVLLSCVASVWLVLLAPGATPNASAAVCETGFLALERGDLEAARTFFESATIEPDCRTAGLAVIESREKAAVSALAECAELLKGAADAPADQQDQVLDEAEERCLVATTLNPELTSAHATLAEVRAAQEAAAEPSSTTDDIEEFSSSALDVAERLLAVVGTWLVVVAVALPFVAMLQLAVGRVGRTNLLDIRFALRRKRWLRITIEALVIAAMVGVLAGEGHFPPWAAWSLSLGVVVVLVAAAFISTDSANALVWVLFAIVFAGSFVLIAWLVPRGNGLVVVGGLVVLLTMLAWVRAQTSALRIGAFGDTTGKVDPPTTFGPLVAAELRRLGRPGRTSIDIVDAPLASQVVDSDSMNSLVGPESKLAGAIYKIASALTRPSDYSVAGFLVEETGSGVGVTVQLKRGPSLVESVTLFAQEFRLPTKPVGGEGDEAETNEAKTDEGDSTMSDGPATTAAKHPDLATAAACWVLAVFTKELVDDDTAVREALNGVEDWRSVAYETLGSRHLAAGDISGSAELYALAVDADPENLSAAFGLAQAGGRRPFKTKSLQLSALGTATDAAHAILKHSPDTARAQLRIRAAYLYVAALANQNALQPSDALAERIRQAACIEASPEGSAEALVRAELQPILSEDVHDSEDSVLRRLRRQTRSSLAPLQIEFGSQVPVPKLTARALETFRGQYNLAAWRAKSLPAREDGREERRSEVLRLLLNVTALPELAAFALVDPYFAALRKDTDFKELVGSTTSEGGTESDLANYVLMGKTRAARLAQEDIRTFRDLADASDEELRVALGEAAPGVGVVARWRAAADLFELPNMGVIGLNLLTVAGVSSRAELATRDPEALSNLLDAAAAGLGLRNSPSANTVKGWIVDAAG